MNNQHYDARRQRAVATNKVFSVRKYSPLVVVCEAFLRRQMGRNYFTFRIFLGGLFVLVLIRLFMNIQVGLYVFQNWVLPPLHPFDFFILAYVVAGIVQLLMIAARDSETEIEHSYFVGQSNVMVLGKLSFQFVNLLISIITYPFRAIFSKNSRFYQLYFREYFKFTFLVVEPLAVLFMSLILLLITQSWVIGFFAVYAGLALWWHNFVLFRMEYNEFIRLGDSRKDGKYKQRRLSETKNYQQRSSRKAQRQQRTEQPTFNPRPIIEETESTRTISPEEFYKKYDTRK